VVPVGNLLMRGMGSLAMLILFLWLKPPVAFLGATVPDQIVNAHILFNVLILVAGLPLAGLVYRVSEKIVALGTKPAPAEALDVVELSALNDSALDVPSQALANATREVVRVCETVEIMLKRIIELYESADADKIKALAALDDRVDKKHASIKLYLAKVTRNPLSEDEALRCQE
ncbi:MAG: Na/Pi cotransporter family protein, partial [Mesorhizobium sp.]